MGIKIIIVLWTALLCCETSFSFVPAQPSIPCRVAHWPCYQQERIIDYVRNKMVSVKMCYRYSTIWKGSLDLLKFFFLFAHHLLFLFCDEILSLSSGNICTGPWRFVFEWMDDYLQSSPPPGSESLSGKKQTNREAQKLDGNCQERH